MTGRSHSLITTTMMNPRIPNFKVLCDMVAPPSVERRPAKREREERRFEEEHSELFQLGGLTWRPTAARTEPISPAFPAAQQAHRLTR